MASLRSRRRCFVPGCRTGTSSFIKNRKLSGLNWISIFGAPRDPEVFEKWRTAIPGHKPFTKLDSICQLHFDEDDIKTYYVTNMPDGTIHKLLRGKKTLRKGAVPNKFDPYTSNNETKWRGKLKEVRERKTLIANYSKRSNREVPVNYSKFSIRRKDIDDSEIVQKIRDTDCFGHSQIVFQNENNESHNEQNATMDPLDIQDEKGERRLHIAAGLIVMPSEWWGVVTTPNYIVCSKFDHSYFPERRVVIKNDLNVKVFLKDYEICIEDFSKISSVSDISQLLQQVDCFEICRGVGDKSMTSCKGYLQRIFAHSRPSYYCEPCKKERKRKSKHRTRHPIDYKARLKIVRDRLRSIMKQNSRLRRKLLKAGQKLPKLPRINLIPQFKELGNFRVVKLQGKESPKKKDLKNHLEMWGSDIYCSSPTELLLLNDDDSLENDFQ